MSAWASVGVQASTSASAPVGILGRGPRHTLDDGLAHPPAWHDLDASSPWPASSRLVEVRGSHPYSRDTATGSDSGVHGRMPQPSDLHKCTTADPRGPLSSDYGSEVAGSNPAERTALTSGFVLRTGPLRHSGGGSSSACSSAARASPGKPCKRSFMRSAAALHVSLDVRGDVRRRGQPCVPEGRLNDLEVDPLCQQERRGGVAKVVDANATDIGLIAEVAPAAADVPRLKGRSRAWRRPGQRRPRPEPPSAPAAAHGGDVRAPSSRPRAVPARPSVRSSSCR